MCGLSGVMSSTISWQEEGMFKDLLSVSSLRGYEGSGVIVSQKKVLRQNPAIRCIRTPLISGALANSAELAELFKPSINAIIGHARWPTRGGNDIHAVHPHRAGHIIGVHNGTLNKVAGNDVKDQSDSKLLFESFAKIGVKETILGCEGAYALVWIDENEQTLNFLRNGQRPLFFKNVGWQKNISTLYWASEREMLDFVFKRTYKGENTWDTYLPTDTWFKYPLDVSHVIKPEEVIADVRPAPKVYPTSFRGNQHQHRSTLFDYHDLNDDINDLPWMRRDERPLALPPPGKGGTVSPQSKAQAKKDLKARKKEAADRLKALKKFHNVQWDDEVQDYVPRLSKEEAKLKETARKGNLGDVAAALAVRTNPTRYMQLEGRPCSWCSTKAACGEIIYPVGSSDLGDTTFVCWDCGSNPDCKDFIDECRTATVSP